ncbi:MAG: fructose-bisphosphatase class III, partial [Christensenellaceae bacterium]
MAISDLKYLELLSKEYPTIQSACTEIINLSAILNLPKGTEHFISDVHGEDEAFCHILNNASGVIREKVNMLFEKNVSTKTRTELCTLIYYPERKLDDIKQSEADLDEWYRITLYRLIDVCRLCASKYTRSKVRKTLPKDFEYIIDELMHTDYDDKDKHDYYENIVSTIISIHRSD